MGFPEGGHGRLFAGEFVTLGRGRHRDEQLGELSRTSRLAAQ